MRYIYKISICSTALLLSITSELGSDCSSAGSGSEHSALSRPLSSVSGAQSQFAYTDRLHALSPHVESHAPISEARHSVPQQKLQNKSTASAATLTTAADFCSREPAGVQENGHTTGPTTTCTAEQVARGVPRALLEPLHAGCDIVPNFISATRTVQMYIMHCII